MRGRQLPERSRYELVITATGRPQLTETLPTSIAFAAYEFIIDPLLENPQRVEGQLKAPLEDRHSARRGTYRVIYRIDDEPLTVIVVAVSARSDAYPPS